MTFRRVLIANRGEIAIRIARACREADLESIAVYSDADRDAPHTRAADRAVRIGPAPSAQSYLDISRIVSAAEITNVDAIHPGYGFLSENAHFAEVCESCNIKFIGPGPEASRQTGDKVMAKELAKRTKIPTVPGSDEAVTDDA